jgi:hypothetical protein
MPEKKTVSQTGKGGATAKRKPRKHGYRGYGSPLGKNAASFGGRVHWGTGFTGVEPLTGSGDTLLKSGLLTEEEKGTIEKSGSGRKKK